MPSSYPGALDSLPTNRTDDTVAKNDHAPNHNDANDAINKIEGELGTDPSGADATVAARLARLSAGLERATDQSLGAAPDTCTFEVVAHDEGWSVGATPVSGLTVSTAGLYVVTAGAVITGTTNRIFEAQVAGVRRAEIHTGATGWGACSVVALCAASDLIRLQYTSGAATTLSRAWLSATRIG